MIEALFIKIKFSLKVEYIPGFISFNLILSKYILLHNFSCLFLSFLVTSCICLGKTNSAAWLVSNHNSASGREQFVQGTNVCCIFKGLSIYPKKKKHRLITNKNEAYIQNLGSFYEAIFKKIFFLISETMARYFF